MKKIFKFLLPTVMMAAMLSGCDDDQNVVQQPTPVQQQQPVTQPEPVDQQPQVVYEQAPQQPQVVVVQQPRDRYYSDNSSHRILTHAAAGALGYYLGKHRGGNVASRRTEVHHYYHSTPRRSYGFTRSRRH